MPRRALPLLAATARAAVPLAAQAPRITPAGDPSVRADTIYKLAVDPAAHPEEDAYFLLDDGVVRVEADGRHASTFRQVVQVLKPDAVERMSEQSFSYAPKHERLTINWIRVVRPNGTVVSARPTHVQDSDVPAEMGDPVYSDQDALRGRAGPDGRDRLPRDPQRLGRRQARPAERRAAQPRDRRAAGRGAGRRLPVRRPHGQVHPVRRAAARRAGRVRHGGEAGRGDRSRDAPARAGRRQPRLGAALGHALARRHVRRPLRADRGRRGGPRAAERVRAPARHRAGGARGHGARRPGLSGRAGRQPPVHAGARPRRAAAPRRAHPGRARGHPVGVDDDLQAALRQHGRHGADRPRARARARAPLPDRAAKVLGGSSVAELRVRMPAGWRAQLPSGLKAAGPFGSYETEYAQEGDVLRVTRRTVGARGIHPPSDRPALAKWMHEVAKDDATFVVLQRPAEGR